MTFPIYFDFSLSHTLHVKFMWHVSVEILIIGQHSFHRNFNVYKCPHFKARRRHVLVTCRRCVLKSLNVDVNPRVVEAWSWIGLEISSRAVGAWTWIRLEDFLVSSNRWFSTGLILNWAGGFFWSPPKVWTYFFYLELNLIQGSWTLDFESDLWFLQGPLRLELELGWRILLVSSARWFSFVLLLNWAAGFFWSPPKVWAYSFFLLRIWHLNLGRWSLCMFSGVTISLPM